MRTKAIAAAMVALFGCTICSAQPPTLQQVNDSIQAAVNAANTLNVATVSLKQSQDALATAQAAVTAADSARSTAEADATAKTEAAVTELRAYLASISVGGGAAMPAALKGLKLTPVPANRPAAPKVKPSAAESPGEAPTVRLASLNIAAKPSPAAGKAAPASAEGSGRPVDCLKARTAFWASQGFPPPAN